jgi:iron only hydrogenase large subunit-like protein
LRELKKIIKYKILFMSARDELIVKYAADLKDKCGVNPNMDLLTKVAIGCGPSIYNADSATVAGTQQSELDTVKNNFLIKKLGLTDGVDLDAGIDAVMEKYGRSNKNKYRVVIYYLLAVHFKKESVYN